MWPDVSEGVEMPGAEQGEEARWVSTACGETGAAVGQRRTTCGGDGRGRWQGWESAREPKSLPPWVQPSSLPPRPMRGHVVQRLSGGLIAPLHTPHRAGDCHTIVLHSASPTPHPTVPRRALSNA